MVSSTLGEVDGDAELIREALGTFVRRLEEEPGKGLAVGDVMPPMALAELGLIDEFEFIAHPRIVGRWRGSGTARRSRSI